MRNGYEIYWTDNALTELAKTLNYLEENFTQKEIRKLAIKIESTTELISKNPNIFPKSEFKDAYKVVILKCNTLYYRIKGDTIEILFFFQIGKALIEEKYKIHNILPDFMLLQLSSNETVYKLISSE